MARVRRMVRFGALVLGIVALNAFLGLEILGLTYRPFSWMTICEAGETTLYPIIHGIQATSDLVSLTVQGEGGNNLALERTISLTEPDWQPVGDTVPTTGEPVLLVDTNPPQPAAFYRANQTTP
jgi:hypothetical protein